MKTRSSSAVGSKVELQFNTDTLRITDLDEDAETPPSSVDVMMDKLKRQNTAPMPGVPTGQSTNAPWERPHAKPGFDLSKSSSGIRTMDTSNKLANILKKS